MRNRKQVKQYDRHLKYVEPPSEGCVFCKLGPQDEQFVDQSAYFKVIRNIFPYTLWDAQRVTDHLLLVPVQHTDSLAHIQPEAAQDFLKTVSQYESQGYAVYARAPGSVTKSLSHQHTHLIKMENRKIRGLFFLHKPYIRFVLK